MRVATSDKGEGIKDFDPLSCEPDFLALWLLSERMFGPG